MRHHASVNSTWGATTLWTRMHTDCRACPPGKAARFKLRQRALSES